MKFSDESSRNETSETPEKILQRVYGHLGIEKWHIDMLKRLTWVEVGNWFIKGNAEFDGENIYFPKKFFADYCREKYERACQASLQLPKLEIGQRGKKKTQLFGGE